MGLGEASGSQVLELLYLVLVTQGTQRAQGALCLRHTYESGSSQERYKSKLRTGGN